MKKTTIEVKAISWFDDNFYQIRYENEAKVEVVDHIPSVTTKLNALAKPYIILWYGDLGTREAQRRRDEAADEGTLLHGAWYCYMNGGAIVYDPFAASIYTKEELDEIFKIYGGQIVTLRTQNQMYNMHKLQRFREIVNPTVVANEVIVYDLECQDAGTVDNIFDIKAGKYAVNGSQPLELQAGRYIVDLKTGKTVGKEARMQVSAYAKIAQKLNYGEIKGSLIVHTQSRNQKGIEGLGVTLLTQEDMAQEYQDYRDIARVWERNFGSQKPVIRQIPSLIAQKIFKGEVDETRKTTVDPRTKKV